MQHSSRKKSVIASSQYCNEDTLTQTQFESNRLLIGFSNMIASERISQKGKLGEKVDRKENNAENDQLTKKNLISRKDRQFQKQKQAAQTSKTRPLRYYKKNKKYNCDNYHFQHGLIQIVFRFKTNNPRWFRLSQIYVRFMLLLAIGGYLSLFGLDMYFTTTSLILGSLILHFLEYQFHQLLNSVRDLVFEQFMIYSRVFLQFLKVLGALGLTIQYLYSVQIVAFGYTVIFDLTVFEFFRYLYKRFLEGSNDQELLTRAQKLRNAKIRDQKLQESISNQLELEKLNRFINP